MSHDNPSVRVFLTSLTAFAVPFAFFAGPVLRFGNIGWIAIAGSGLGAGASVGWSAMRHGRGRRWETGSIALLVACALALTLLFTDAVAGSAANDRRCLAIQRDMLSARPRRADGPDLFQALGCRPQGEGSVYIARR